MAIITGKSELCRTDDYLKYFKSLQGIGGKTLFERYPSFENIVNNNIDDKYKCFLAQPAVKNDSSIIWYGKTYHETPQLLSELQGEELEKYERIKDETLTYYGNKINALRQSGKGMEADFLAGATKFIDERFIYCYDDMVVLGVWGMQLRNEIRDTTGIVMKNLIVPVKQVAPAETPVETTTEMPVETPVETLAVPPVPPQPPVTPVTPILPKKRFWSWFNWKRLLWLLLWLLLLLLLLLLFCWLFRNCSGRRDFASIPEPIDDKPWIYDDPNVGDDGGIYDPGNPYTPVPTLPDYGAVLPPQQGVLPPIEDDTEIIPGNPTIIGNRLNILMENEDKSILNLAKDFKAKYPDDKYKVIYYDDIIKRMQIKIPKEERERLKQEIPSKFAPEYELFVFDEALFEGNYTPDDPAFADSDKSWYLHAIKAPQAWEITRGSPKLTVAIVDNGFNLSHPELSSKVVMPYNVWTHSNEVFPQKIDHGTHVAGTALAIADNGKGICGVAPGCAFMPVQVADARGLMTTTSILDGILYALYQGANVINVSLGGQFTGLSHFPENMQEDLIHNHFKEEERLWREIMRIAARHNSVVVVAAGNDNVLAGIDALQRPELFVTVSAVDKNNRNYGKADFSNYGSYSTVSAPGVDIYSSVGKNGYQTMSGTSMAAPIVTGAIALMKSVNDSITSKQIICILQTTGLPMQDNIGNLIQLDKALEIVKSGKTVDCRPIPSTGDVQILLEWNNYNDLDLRCIDPYGAAVWYKNKRVPSGGFLEIDMNVEYPDSKTPVENIYWATGSAPSGTYEVHLTYFRRHESAINETPYAIKVKYGDKTEDYSGSIRKEDNAIRICSFTLNNGNSIQNPNSPNPNNPLNRRSHLEQERKRLQRELERINEELRQIGNSR